MPTDNTYSPWNNKIDYCFIVADKNQSVVALEIGMNLSEEVPEGIHNITHAYVHTFVQCAIVHAHEYLKSVVHNVRPAGHIRSATSRHVARGVQQEMGLF